MAIPRVTSRAAFRWAQKIKGTVSAGESQLSSDEHYRAVSDVLRAYYASYPVSARTVALLRGGDPAKWPRPAIYRITVDALLILQDHHIITVQKWGLELYAEVVTHHLFGVWSPGHHFLGKKKRGGKRRRRYEDSLGRKSAKKFQR